MLQGLAADLDDDEAAAAGKARGDGDAEGQVQGIKRESSAADDAEMEDREGGEGGGGSSRRGSEDSAVAAAEQEGAEADVQQREVPEIKDLQHESEEEEQENRGQEEEPDRDPLQAAAEALLVSSCPESCIMHAGVTWVRRCMVRVAWLAPSKCRQSMGHGNNGFLKGRETGAALAPQPAHGPNAATQSEAGSLLIMQTGGCVVALLAGGLRGMCALDIKTEHAMPNWLLLNLLSMLAALLLHVAPHTGNSLRCACYLLLDPCLHALQLLANTLFSSAVCLRPSAGVPTSASPAV